MKKVLKYLAIAFSVASLMIFLSSCVPDSDRMVPAGAGAAGAGSLAQPVPHSVGNQSLPVTTAWAESQARQSPEPSAEPSVEPTVEPSAEATPIPQGVPDDWNTIEGFQEVYNVSTIQECHDMNKKFQQQGILLSLYDIIPINATGRLNTPRRKAGKRTALRRGRMYLCVFRGTGAVENRYGVNDDYQSSGVQNPDYHNHPNEYRHPDPFNQTYSNDPSMGEPPDPNATPPY